MGPNSINRALMHAYFISLTFLVSITCTFPMGPNPKLLLEITQYDGRHECQCTGDQNKSKKMAGHSTFKGSPEESLKGLPGMRAGLGESAGMVDTGVWQQGAVLPPSGPKGRGLETRERGPCPKLWRLVKEHRCYPQREPHVCPTHVEARGEESRPYHPWARAAQVHTRPNRAEGDLRGVPTNQNWQHTL